MSEQNQNNDQQLNSTESQGIPSVVGKKTNKSTKKAGFMLLLIALLLFYIPQLLNGQYICSFFLPLFLYCNYIIPPFRVEVNTFFKIIA